MRCHLCLLGAVDVPPPVEECTRTKRCTHDFVRFACCDLARLRRLGMKLRAIVTTQFLCVAVAFTSRYSFSQVTTAAVHGTVTDPAGAVIPNAEITVLNTSTGISTKTRSDNGGYFKVSQLQIGGPYTITVESQGFASFAAKGIQLNVNDDREVSARLTV